MNLNMSAPDAQPTQPGVLKRIATAIRPSKETKVAANENATPLNPEKPLFKPLLRELVEIKGPEKHDLTIEKFNTAPIYHKALLEGLQYAHKKINGNDPRPNGFEGSIPDMLLKLYEAQNGKIKDIDQITEKEMAVFMEKNGGNGVDLATYMLELKGLAISQAADMYYDIKQEGKTPPDHPSKIVGQTVEITPDGILEAKNISKSGGFLGINNIPEIYKNLRGYYKGKNAKMELHFANAIDLDNVRTEEINNNFDPLNLNSMRYDQFYNRLAQDFLKEARYNEVDLTKDASKKFILTEFTEITRARQELFVQTGGKLEDFNPNFLNKHDVRNQGGIAEQRTHFLLEKNNGNYWRKLSFQDQESQTRKVVTEIKDKLAKEKSKQMKEDKEKHAEEGSIFRLDERHKKIKEEADEAGADEKAEKVEKKGNEKKELDKKIATIKSSETIDEEKDKADLELVKTQDRIQAKNAQLSNGVDLIAWDGNGADGYRTLEKKAGKLTKNKTKIETTINGFDAEIDKIENRRESRLKAFYKPILDPASGAILSYELSGIGVGISNQIDGEIDAIKQKIDKQKEKLTEKKYDGNSKTIEEEIDRLTELSESRKEVVEEEENAELLSDRKKAEKEVKRLELKQTEVHLEYGKLETEFNVANTRDPNDSDELKKFYRDKLKLANKEIKELDENDPDVQSELDAILLLKETFGSENTTKREDDLFNWEQALVIGTEQEKIMVPDELPEFKAYPETVKQTMRLIFGEYVFSPSTEGQVLKTDKARALLHSEKYLQVIVDAIETKLGVDDADKIIFVNVGPNQPNKKLSDAEVTTLFENINITPNDIREIDRDLIKSIVTNLKERALEIS